MRIVIPTHRRVHKQTTLMALPADLRRETLLVTSDEAESSALRKYFKADGVSVKTAPVKTIADKRQWILENVRDDVFMLDDDMVFYRRCPQQHRAFVGGRWKPKDPAKHKGLSLDFVSEAGVLELFERLRDELYGHDLIGISSRFGNDLEDNEWRSGANRLMHGFGYDRATLRAMKFKFNAVQFREDFHMALSAYRAGRPSWQSYEWCVAPGAYGAPGGCSAERTVAASDAAAHDLAALHPGFVRVVDKDYKGTPRKEVVVSWKKALESSRK